MPRPPAPPGFTLLELSVVLIVVGLLAGTTVAAMKPTLDAARLAQTRNKLDAIEDALFAFRVANARLPCPADLTRPAGGPAFGAEAATPGTCTGGVPAANRSGGKGGVEGGVPVAALGLPRDFAYDGYGRKYVYAVDTRYTAAGAFASFTAPNNCGGLTVTAAGGAAVTARGMYVLLSHGPNGHGGYTDSGAHVSAGSANPDEQENCDCDAAAASGPYDATYVRRDAYLTSKTNQFDDALRVRERWQWRAPDERSLGPGVPCARGFRLEGSEPGRYFGGTGVAVGDTDADGRPDVYVAGFNRTYLFRGAAAWADGGTASAADLTGANGTRILNGSYGGSFCYGHPPFAVAAADVNADGRADLVNNTWGINNQSVSGEFGTGTPVVYGTAAAHPVPLDLDAAPPAGVPLNRLDGTRGALLNSYLTNPRTGTPTAPGGMGVAAADVNGDGRADVVTCVELGGYYGTGNKSGYCTVTFGGTFAGLAQVKYAQMDGTRGTFVTSGWTGLAADWERLRLMGTGDVNGDGFDDVVIGATASAGGVTSSAAYVVFGRAGGWPAAPASIDLRTPDGTSAVKVTGLAGDIGYVADANADGYADVVLPDAVLAGGSGLGGGGYPATVSKAAWLGTPGRGTAVGGESIGAAAAGDVDGDGRADAVFVSRNAADGARATVLWGPAGWGATATLGPPPAAGTGFQLTALTEAGYALSLTVADVDGDGDGRADLVFGDQSATIGGTANTGRVHVVFGKPRPLWAATQSAAALTAP